MREARAELLAHIGSAPSAVQRALVEQAVQLRLRLALMDLNFAQTGEMTGHDSKAYLAWSSAYSRLLSRLGMKAAPTPRRTLDDHAPVRQAAA